MLFESLQTFFFAVMTLFAFLFFRMSLNSQALMTTTHKEIITLIVNFRKELKQAIEEALRQHIREYHK